MALSFLFNDVAIKNFRSFDNAGVTLGYLQKINILIGKNNSGKSNVLRFLNLLSESANNPENFPGSVHYNRHRSSDGNVCIGFKILHMDLKWPRTIINKKRYGVDLISVIPNPIFAWYDLKRDKVDLINQLDGLKDFEPFDLRELVNPNATTDFGTLEANIEVMIKMVILKKIKSLNDSIYIPEIRIINSSVEPGKRNSDINGNNIISKLSEMQRPNTGNEHKRQLFDKIEGLVKNLLNSKDLSLEISFDSKEIIVNMHGNRLPLESYGSGIYQIILLCSALVAYDERWIFIEEPETHMHPELQRKFLEFLVKETNNRYLITTHSNTFINYNSSTSIFHVSHDLQRSQINRVITQSKSFELLIDLGYKASDILQTNGIIWVEGPSDRNFLLKWISLIDDTLIEGIHFSIMFYGGKNLANISFEKEHELTVKHFEYGLIPIMQLNKNAFVVIDSDIFKNVTHINKTKSRIRSEIGEGKFWITVRKEIEDYLSPDVIIKWLSAENSYNGKKLVYEENKTFSDQIQNCHKNIKFDYSSQKNKYSQEINSHIELTDLNYLDLEKTVRVLVKNIKKWNHEK